MEASVLLIRWSNKIKIAVPLKINEWTIVNKCFHCDDSVWSLTFLGLYWRSIVAVVVDHSTNTRCRHVMTTWIQLMWYNGHCLLQTYPGIWERRKKRCQFWNSFLRNSRALPTTTSATTRRSDLIAATTKNAQTWCWQIPNNYTHMVILKLNSQ